MAFTGARDINGSKRLKSEKSLNAAEDAKQKDSDDELHKELWRFRSLAEYSPIGMVLIDEEGNFAYTNPKFKELFGFGLEEVSCGRDWFRRAYPDPAYRHDVISTWINDSKEAGPGEKRPRIFDVTCKDGTKKIIKFVAITLEDGGDLLTCEDVTASKRSEQDLKAAYDQLLATIEFLPDATFAIDKEKRVIAWNRAMEDMTGVLKKEILGKGDYLYGVPFYGKPRLMLIDLIDDPNSDINTSIHSKYLRIDGKGGNICGEAYVPSLFNGRGAYVWATASKLLDSEGNKIGAIESIRDITERKMAEKSLQEVNSKLQAMVQASPLAIIFIDDKGIVQSWNQAAERIFGWREDDVLGRPLPSIRDNLRDEFHNISDHAFGLLEQGRSFADLETREHTKDGSLIDVTLSFTALKDMEGNVVGHIALAADITERKTAQMAFQENLRFLQRLIDTIPNPIFFKDTKGIYQGCNSAFEKFIGLSKENIIGKSVYDIYPSDLADKYWEMDRALFDSPGIQVYEFSLLYADGTKHDVIFNKATYANSSGNLSGLVGVVLDITERKRAEEKLRSAHQQLEDIIDFLPDATFVIDSEKRVIAWNRAIEEMTGVYKEEVMGKNDYAYSIPFYGKPRPILIDLVNMSDEEVESRYNFIEKKGNTLFGEAYVPSLRGREAYLWGTASPLHDSTGKLIASIESIRNVTDHKKAEEAVRESEERFKAIFDTAEDSIFIKDHSLKYIQVNPAMERLFGLPSSELIGKTDKELFGIKAAEIINKADRCVLNGEINRDKHTIPVQGRPTTFHTIKVPMRCSSGEITGICGIARDISELKRVEEALEAAKEIADASTRAKSAFLANMSHEIRTPMNAVIGMTGLLLETEMTPEQKEYVETIRYSGETLLSIVNDILDLSKIEGGKAELELQPFDLRLCIERSLQFVSADAARKGLDLACMIDEGTPKVLIGDPIRLRQILVNLLSNAVKFTDKGRVEVSVNSRRLEENCHEIRFVIKDTGIGIPEDKMIRLFQPFSQVDASTTRRYGGTGLGLAICKKLVEGMGGEIRAESREGIGSTFYFSISAKASIDEPVDTARVLSKTSPTVKFDEGSDSNTCQDHDVSMLLAEDNAVNQRVMLHMLAKLGYHADVVANGLEVLQALGRKHYDIVLMDVQMPEMDGLEAARAIRKGWPLTDQPRIIAITAYAMQGDKKVCFDAGMDDYISKPVTLEELKAVISLCRKA